MTSSLNDITAAHTEKEILAAQTPEGGFSKNRLKSWEFLSLLQKDGAKN